MAFNAEFVVAALVVIVLFKKINFLNYHIKFYAYYAWVMGISTLLMPYFMLKPRNVLNLL